MTKHTPGPWVIFGKEGEYIEIEAGGTIIADVYDGDGWADGEANARVMVAAPDMLAALKEIVGGSTPSGVWRDKRGAETTEDDPEAVFEEYSLHEQRAWLEAVVDIARAAIAKAEGKPA